MTTRRHNNLPWAVANDELSYLYAPFSLSLSNLAYVIVVNGDHPSVLSVKSVSVEECVVYCLACH